MYEIPLYEVAVNYFTISAIMTGSALPLEELQKMKERLAIIDEFLKEQVVDREDRFVQHIMGAKTEEITAYDVAKTYSDSVMEHLDDSSVSLTDTGVILQAPVSVVQAFYGDQTNLAFQFLKKIS